MSSSNSDNIERRRYSRIPFVGDVILQEATGTQSWPCQLIDVSLAGALLDCPANFPGVQDETFHLIIKLSDEQTQIAMIVTVAHQQKGRLGFLCKLIDTDSITHLRRLVELNLGDAELMKRELGQLASRNVSN